jgi:hypothetical protein
LEEKDLILKEYSKNGGAFMWLNKKNNKIFIGSTHNLSA